MFKDFIFRFCILVHKIYWDEKYIYCYIFLIPFSIRQLVLVMSQSYNDSRGFFPALDKIFIIRSPYGFNILVVVDG